MSISRFLVVVVLVLLVIASSCVGLVLSFALLLRNANVHTVWDSIIPWSADRLDIVTTFVVGGTVLVGVLMKRSLRRDVALQSDDD